MSKGSSELLSKFQFKRTYSSTGIIGDVHGYEVLREVLLRVESLDVFRDHEILIEGRIMNSTSWDRIGALCGVGSEVFKISSYDFVRLSCTSYVVRAGAPARTVVASAAILDGDFVVDAINEATSEIKKLQKDMHCLLQNILDENKKQTIHLSFITEEDIDG